MDYTAISVRKLQSRLAGYEVSMILGNTWAWQPPTSAIFLVNGSEACAQITITKSFWYTQHLQCDGQLCRATPMLDSLSAERCCTCTTESPCTEKASSIPMQDALQSSRFCHMSGRPYLLQETEEERISTTFKHIIKSAPEESGYWGQAKGRQCHLPAAS